MEAKKIKKKFLTIAAVFFASLGLVVLLWKPITVWVAAQYFSCFEKAAQMPDSGAYYSHELDATITCKGGGTVLLVNGQSIEIWAEHYSSDYSGFAKVEEVSASDPSKITTVTKRICYLTCHWDQKKNELLVEIYEFPTLFEEGKTYRFVQTP